jgi:hypothetical protein
MFQDEARFGRMVRIRRCWLRIPMMSISHSDLMPIRSERSDAGLSQCETVIDIRQGVCLFFSLAAWEVPAFRLSVFWGANERSP